MARFQSHLKVKKQTSDPYGVLNFTHWITKNYRAYNIFRCNGILFNHENPKLKHCYKKNNKGINRIKMGRQKKLLKFNSKRGGDTQEIMLKYCEKFYKKTG